MLATHFHRGVVPFVLFLVVGLHVAGMLLTLLAHRVRWKNTQIREQASGMGEFCCDIYTTVQSNGLYSNLSEWKETVEGPLCR